MKHEFAGMMILAGGICASSASCAQRPAGEGATSQTSEPLLTVGCQTTPISANGDPDSNAGAAISGAAFGTRACYTAVPSYTTPLGSTYPGTFACTDEAVLELDGASGSAAVNATVAILDPPADEATCNQTQIEGILWGYTTSGTWVTVPGQPTSPTFAGSWLAGAPIQCQIGIDEVGMVVDSVPIDFSQYTQVRFVGRAFTYVTNSKGVTTEQALQVKLSVWQYCIS